MIEKMPTGVEEFFADFARRSNDPAGVGDFFDDPFLSLNPNSSTVVQTAQLAAALPARAAMFREIGVTTTRLTALDEQGLDEHHVLAHTTWSAQNAEGAEVLTLSSSYVLRRIESGWRIAVYLNHADIGNEIAQRRSTT